MTAKYTKGAKRNKREKERVFGRKHELLSIFNSEFRVVGLLEQKKRLNVASESWGSDVG